MLLIALFTGDSSLVELKILELDDDSSSIWIENRSLLPPDDTFLDSSRLDGVELFFFSTWLANWRFAMDLDKRSDTKKVLEFGLASPSELSVNDGFA